MDKAVGVTGDQLEILYPQWSARLEAVVARNVSASEDVVEEACQVAWGQLHAQRERVMPSSALAWLCTTATREALRLARRGPAADHLSLDAASAEAAVLELPAREPGPEQVAQLHEQLAEVHALPDRQRRMVWLQAAGYDYAEIAARTGDTRRTVERQLLRAHRRLAVERLRAS